jgi:tetratricopeptide (TPR) repeat protein
MGTEARPEETDQAAWSVLKEWLARDEAGKTVLTKLLADPEAGAQALLDQLRSSKAPALAATWVSGGNIGKLVAIARAEQVIIAQAPSAPPTPHQLPPDVALFTGREAELARLRALVPEGTAGTVVISAIAGTPGVGKTTLAVHLAHELVPRFPDAQLFVNLHGYDASQRLSPARALDRFLLDLGVAAEARPGEVERKAALYRSLLADKRALVVLDNASSTEQVRDLLPGSPTCLVLLTSRRRLAALEGALPLDLDIMDSDDALSLLTKLAGSERVEAEPKAANAIVALCGRLPLALRIAGARLAARPEWSLTWLAEQLADESTRLEELEVENLEVRASFALSYKDLDEPLRRMFRRLGLAAGTNFAAGVAAVLYDTDITLKEAEKLMGKLVDARLLETAPTPRRYQFHDLLRLYAQEQVQAEETDQEQGDARRRMLDWYRDSAAAADRALTPGLHTLVRERLGDQPGPISFTHDPAVGWFDAEWAALVAATRQAFDAGLDAIAWQLPDAMFSFAAVRWYWADWRGVCEIGRDAARRAHDRQSEAWMLTSIGSASRGLEQYEEALDCLQQALVIQREIGYRRGESWALHYLGLTSYHMARPDEAIDYYQQALAIDREIGYRYGEGWDLQNLGMICARSMRLDEALDYLQQALTIHRAFKDRRGEGWTLGYLGFTYHFLGRFDEAIDCYQQAVAIADGFGFHFGRGLVRGYLGITLQRTQGVDVARAYWQEALAIFAEHSISTPETEMFRSLLESSNTTSSG